MLRKLHQADLPQIIAIENAAQVSPWTPETFQICAQPDFFHWVVEFDKKILGFIIISLREKECHILNLCVANHAQHAGWGRKLLEEAITYSKTAGAIIAYLEVRRSNTRAINLYKNAGFFLLGERKDYYPVLETREDALVFGKNLYVASSSGN